MDKKQEVDKSKIMIGDDVLLDIGIDSEWEIRNISYCSLEPSVTIELRKKRRSDAFL